MSPLLILIIGAAVGAAIVMGVKEKSPREAVKAGISGGMAALFHVDTDCWWPVRYGWLTGDIEGTQ